MSKPRSTLDVPLSGITRHAAYLATLEVIEFGLENSPFPAGLPKLPKRYRDLRKAKPDRVIAIETGPPSVFNREVFAGFADTV